jgi:hypothetical protein
MSAPVETQAERAEDAIRRDLERALRVEEGAGVEPPESAIEPLPSQPLRFVLHFLGHYKWLLAAIVLLETGQALRRS